jgi:Fic family protein
MELTKVDPKIVKKFLSESNNIEDVWDEDSLKQALYAWKYITSVKNLSIGTVLKTHKILMLHSGLLPSEKGYFRKVPVWIGGHEAKPWFVVPELMVEWIQQANETVQYADKLRDKAVLVQQIKDDHVFFESIHPFIDGNGRLGRILMNWQRVKVGLPIEIIYEKKKSQYYKWFQ